MKRELRTEFEKTESIFNITKNKTYSDLKATRICWEFIERITFNATVESFLSNFSKLFNMQPLLTDSDVKLKRLAAWDNAFNNNNLLGIDGRKLNTQPVLSHQQLFLDGWQLYLSYNKEKEEITDNKIDNKVESKKEEISEYKAPLRTNDELEQKTKENHQKINEKFLVGGDTPENLGEVLLKALKNNDKELWIRCLHPVYTNYRSINIDRFNRIRENLEANGLTKWNLVKFSHVTYSKESGWGSDDNGIVDNEQVRRHFYIHFTYRNKEFYGSIGYMTIKTHKQKKYFVFYCDL